MSSSSTHDSPIQRKFDCKICGAFSTNTMSEINKHVKICKKFYEEGICSDCKVYPSESFPASNLNLCWACFNAITKLDLDDLD